MNFIVNGGRGGYLEHTILNFLYSHEEEIIQDLKCLVDAQASTNERQKLNYCRKTLEKLIFDRTGISPNVYKTPNEHDIVWFEFGAGKSSIMLLGHYDTVHPAGSISYEEIGNKLKGPGIYDMKSGLISAIWTVKSFQNLGIVPDSKIIVVFNGDEETGSVESKEFISQIARKVKAALVLEPSAGSGDLKTGRKGMVQMHVSVKGKEAHSGNAHSEGINALEEMAHEIIFAQQLTNYKRGITVNVGIANGGTRTNVVPGFAEFYVEARAKTRSDLDYIIDTMRSLKVKIPNTYRECKIIDKHNPMEETEDTLKLFELAKKCGIPLLLSFSHQIVGGVSDANTIAELGVPVLDGLGAVGGDAHSPEEYIWRDKYLPRIGLAASRVLHL